MYTGQERRKETRYCEGHITLCEDIAVIKTTVLALDKRINGSIGTIEKHIDNSRGRNFAIVLVFLGMLAALFTFAVGAGQDKKQIEINTKRWEKFIEANGVIG